MNDSGDKHAPTEEFVEYLARDTMRRLRHEARFTPSPAKQRSRSRIPTALGIAAGVVMTLSTGMVLGASANYASAAVLPNGTTTIPSRPALAILPIRNALTAIGCTQPVEQPVAPTKAVASVATFATTSAPTAASAVEPTTSDAAAADHVVTPTAPAKPDRALIATLARQHQAAVVRGDSASEYLVLLLDTSQNYLWSTHGNGNVSIEVGGDVRTSAERVEYNRVHASELMGNFKLFPSDSSRSRNFRSSRDTQALHVYQFYRGLGTADSIQNRTIRLRQADSSRVVRRDRADSATSVYAYGSSTAAGCGTRYARQLRAITADSAPSSYSSGFSEPRHGLSCNLAAGLQARVAGQSGIVGLASASVSKTEMYVFQAGELAPRDLKVLAVYLTPGTAWAGR